MKIKGLALKVLKWVVICILTGLCCGIIGAAFSGSILLVTYFRTQYNWLIYLLPLGGILSVFIYKSFKISGVETSQVFSGLDDGKGVSRLLAPGVFICSVISHAFGASVGREGAALQIGGSFAQILRRPLRLTKEQTRALTYCAMAGMFSAVFGTPLAAVIYILEERFLGIKRSVKYFVPVLLTCVISYFSAVYLGVEPERFEISSINGVNVLSILKVLCVGIAVAILGFVFYLAKKYLKIFLFRFIKNEYFIIVLGGVVTVLIVSLLEAKDCCGAGIQLIECFTGGDSAKLTVLLLKIVLTVIAISCGYKGGEIIPSLFIGAAFGSILATVLGLPVGFCAALGMTAMFCSVTGCMFASSVLALEMFGGKGFVYMLVVSAVVFGLKKVMTSDILKRKNYLSN